MAPPTVRKVLARLVKAARGMRLRHCAVGDCGRVQ
jgi:hypothetical protein